MKQEKVYADLYLHLHTDKLMHAAREIERRLQATPGVASVYFGDECRQSVYIAYDPKTISSENLLDVVRQHCARAVRVASIYTRTSALNAKL